MVRYLEETVVSDNRRSQEEFPSMNKKRYNNSYHFKSKPIDKMKILGKLAI